MAAEMTSMSSRYLDAGADRCSSVLRYVRSLFNRAEMYVRKWLHRGLQRAAGQSPSQKRRVNTPPSNKEIRPKEMLTTSSTTKLFS